jgi:hypothetical protein
MARTLRMNVETDVRLGQRGVKLRLLQRKLIHIEGKSGKQENMNYEEQGLVGLIHLMVEG